MRKAMIVMMATALVVVLAGYTVMPGYTKGTTGTVRKSLPREQVPYTPSLFRGPVLFVEDPGDLAFGPATKPDPNWSGVLTNLLGAGNFGWFGATTACDEDGPSLDTMNLYQLVIWNCYDDWWDTPAPALTTNDQSNLANYINTGGKVWFIGQDAIWSGVPYSFFETNFYMQSVTEDYVNNDASLNLQGLAETGGLSFTATSDYQSNGFYCDNLTANTSGHQIITETNYNGFPGIAAENTLPLLTSFWTVDGRGPSVPQTWEDMVDSMLTAFGILGGVEDRPGVQPSMIALAPLANPIRDRATIHYSTVQPGAVKLSVYDIQGKVVQVLVDRNESAGYKTAVWNLPTGISSGVYFVRLEADGKTATRKAVIVN